MKAIGGEQGITLVEIMIVVAIIGLLASVLGTSFQGWMEKHKVEDETKRLFFDISEARARALQKNRVHFVQLNPVPERYRTYDDASPAPDGDGILQTANDILIANTPVTYPIQSGLVAGGVAQTTFQFNRDGTPWVLGGAAPVSGYVQVITSLSPEYDCINISMTRIKLGRMNGGTCQER